VKLTDKRSASIGSRQYVWYSFEVPEVKTESGCIELARKIAGLGKVERISCTGYHDMDTHENYAFFDSLDDFESGLKGLKKIDVDTITVKLLVGDSSATVEISPVWDNERGTGISVRGTGAEAAKKVADALQKMKLD